MMKTVMVATRSAKNCWMAQARARFKSTVEGRLLKNSRTFVCDPDTVVMRHVIFIGKEIEFWLGKRG